MSHTRRKRLLVRPNSGLKDAPISKRARRDCKTSPFVRASASTAKPELQDGADFKTRGVGLDGIISVGSQLGLTTEDLSDVLGEPKDEAKTEEAEGLSSELPPVLRAAAEDPRGLLETIVDSDSDGAASGERRPAEALVAEASPEALAARLRACAAALASGKAGARGRGTGQGRRGAEAAPGGCAGGHRAPGPGARGRRRGRRGPRRCARRGAGAAARGEG
ncbi:unnamed protein product, partial [Prorocentrum cordatum]